MGSTRSAEASYWYWPANKINDKAERAAKKRRGRTGGEAVELFKVDGALGADSGEDRVSGLGQVRGRGGGSSDEEDLVTLADESRCSNWGHGCNVMRGESVKRVCRLW